MPLHTEQERVEARDLAPVQSDFRIAYSLRLRKQGRLFLAELGKYRELWDRGLQETGDEVLPHIGDVWARVNGATATTGVSQVLGALDASVVLGNRQMIYSLAAQRGIPRGNTRMMRRFLFDIFRNDPAATAALSTPLGKSDPVRAVMDTAQDDGQPRGRISSTSPFTVRNRRAEQWIRNRGAELVAQIDDVTRQQIQTVLMKGQREGTSYSTVARQLKNRFEVLATPSPLKHIRSRAELIAVTETRFAQTYGKTQMAQSLQDRGLPMRKRWITIGDERVSDGCEDLGNLGWIPANEPFDKAGDGPPLHPGCRCVMSHRVAV